MIRQPAVKGVVRARLSSRAAIEIEKKIVATAIRYDCSKSFVIAIALATAFKVNLDEVEMFQALIARPRPYRRRKLRRAA